MIPYARYVDNWLWAASKRREEGRRRREQLGDALRRKVRDNTRRYRARLKEAPRLQLIRSVYWHEIHHPDRPLRSLKNASIQQQRQARTVG